MAAASAGVTGHSATKRIKLGDGDVPQYETVIVEGYCGGSHAQLIDLLEDKLYSKQPSPRHLVIRLPAKKWHWKLKTGHLAVAQRIPRTHQATKVLFVTSMIDMAGLLGLRPDLHTAKKIYYMHENQLEYPSRQGENWKKEERDYQLGWAQICSALVADVVAFNSCFNRDSFLVRLGPFLRKVPDSHFDVAEVEATVRAKCMVVHFPLHFTLPADLRSTSDNNNNGSDLRILWNHRWEHDKNPAAFLKALMVLHEKGTKFQVCVLGEDFTASAEDRELVKTVKSVLTAQGKVRHWGYAENREAYFKAVGDCDVVVSTAFHEFFGVAVLEGALMGCTPLVPKRLVYPELFPNKELWYNTDVQFAKKLHSYSFQVDKLRTWKKERKWVKELNLEQYTWDGGAGQHFKDLMTPSLKDEREGTETFVNSSSF